MHAHKHLARNPGDPMFGPLWRIREVNPRSTTSMYGHGKSDKPIVPMKLANKGFV